MKQTVVNLGDRKIEVNYKCTREGTCYLIEVEGSWISDEYGVPHVVKLTEDELDEIESKIGYQEYRADH